MIVSHMHCLLENTKNTTWTHLLKISEYIKTNKLEKNKTPCEIRTCLLYNKSRRLRPLHHSGRYSHPATVMVH